MKKKTVDVLEDQPDRQERQGLECSSRTCGCFYYALCLYLALTQSTCSGGVKQANLKLRGKVTWQTENQVTEWKEGECLRGPNE